jgi:uncharacterized membrane protein YkvA (DUF1232 family)
LAQREFGVSEQLRLHPTGLTRSQAERLAASTEAARQSSPAVLLDAARRHLQAARAAHARNRLVNVRLAAAILTVIETVVASWETLPPQGTLWLRGAIHYFANHNDDEPDFHSPIGFEDDIEILNACLRFARRADLCLNVADYDDA